MSAVRKFTPIWSSVAGPGRAKRRWRSAVALLAVAGLLLPSAALAQPRPEWLSELKMASVDGVATLKWTVPGTEPITLFRISEQFSGQQQISFTDQAEMLVFRVEPGAYEFRVQSCVRTADGFPQCGKTSQRLLLTVAATQAVDDRASQPSSSAPAPEFKSVDLLAGGPDRLRPGHWYNPARDGHGWSFYWANRLALPETHAQHGYEYDLVGTWYTYEAKVRYQDGPAPCGEGSGGIDCYWVYEDYRPVVARLKLVRTSATSYGGGIFIMRNGSEYQQGSATVTFGSSNTRASLTWSATFKKQSLSGSDAIELLVGSGATASTDASHYGGLWGLPNDPAIEIVNDLGSLSEAAEILFPDAAGDPTWILAYHESPPGPGSTSMCFFSVQSGYAPNANGTLLYYDSGCDSAQPTSLSNRNGRRYFTDFEQGRIWAEFILPGGSSAGSLQIGSASSPALMVKKASFHRIYWQADSGSTCTLTPLSATCGLELTWFTDGDYPAASVHVLNTSSGQRSLVSGSNGPATLGYPVNLSEIGQYQFELRMGSAASSSLMATSSVFTVTSQSLASPQAMHVAWLNEADRRFRVQWSHPDVQQVGWYELEETRPEGSGAATYVLSPGSLLYRDFSYFSGPYGTYGYRVRACVTASGEAQCSDWAAGVGWAVTSPTESGVAAHPWGDHATGPMVTNLTYHYAMGYHFRPEVNGTVTHLGGLFNGVKAVRLFERASGILLSETTVSATNNWRYASITPVPVSAGMEYTVAAYLAGSGASSYASAGLPVSRDGITILGSTYAPTTSNPVARPTNLVTSTMYGQADIGFVAEAAPPANQPPVFVSAPGDQSGVEGDVVSLQMSGSDPDGDALTFSGGASLPAGLALTSSGLIHGQLAAGAAVGSPYPVVIILSDGQPGHEVTAQFTWTVLPPAPPANTAPVISPPPGQHSTRGVAIAPLTVTVSDAENDSVTCSFSGLPAGLAGGGECVISGTVTAPIGVYTVQVDASDGRLDAASVTFSWTISEGVTPSNPETPPEPAGPPDMSADAVSSAVGATAGTFSVDPNGSATYHLPIQTAPGSGGAAPRIALAYSSQAGNGHLGPGWTIDGLSTITRCGQTLEQDGPAWIGGINLTSTDRFCLDGSRLVLVSGSYGADGSEYRTETDEIRRIRASGVAGSGPASFAVWSKDGSVTQYGSTADSRVEARTKTDSQTVLMWAQNRVTDTAGNFVDYHYDERHGAAGEAVEITLDSVAYTGNSRSGTVPYAAIRFVYSGNRPDATVSAVAGSLVARSRLLVRVDSLSRVSAGAALTGLRSYHLVYGEDGHRRQVLESVEECRDATRTTCFAPTSFTWQKSRHGFGSTGIAFGSVFSKKHVALALADVNGDGRPDLLLSEQNRKSFRFRVALAQPAGGFLSPSSVSYDIPTNGTADVPVTLHVIDLNADGLQDVVYPAKDGWKARLSTGGAFGPEITVSANCCGLTNPPLVRIMDYDGDGLSDILTSRAVDGQRNELVLLRNRFSPAAPDVVGFDPAQALSVVFTSNLFPEQSADGWVIDTEAPRFAEQPSAGAAFGRAFDFNGDGAADLLVRLSQRYVRCTGSCTATADTATSQRLASVSQFIIDEQSTELDSDSSLETEFSYAWASFYVLLLSDGGNAFIEQAVVGRGVDCTVDDACNPFAGLPVFRRVQPVDINGDGLADIAYLDALYDWRGRINLGGALHPADIPIAAFADSGQSSRAHFQDITGDGYPEFVYPSALGTSGATWVMHENRFGLAFGPAQGTGATFGNTDEGDISLLLDANGDGLMDNLFIDRDARGNIQSSSTRVTPGRNIMSGSPNQAHTAISRIREGFGAQTTITHLPLTDSLVYTRLQNGNTAAWGNGSAVHDLVAPSHVVSRVDQSAPLYGQSAAVHGTLYHYVGARIQGGGRGYLGFAETIAWDNATGIRTNTRLRQDFPFIGKVFDTLQVLALPEEKFATVSNPAATLHQPWPEVTATTRPPSFGGSGILLGYTVNGWATIQTVDGHAVHHPYTAATLERRYSIQGDFDRKVFTSRRVDRRYGNVEQQVVQTFAVDSDGPFATRTDSRAFLNDVASWRLGRLASSTVTHARAGTADIVRQSSFTYDAGTGILSREVTEPNQNPLKVTTDYVLDNFGNRITTTVTGSGMAPRTSGDQYDPLGRFVISSSNSFGQTTHRVLAWDAFGTALKAQNIDGVETITSVDGMGRPHVSYTDTGAWTRGTNRTGAGSHCPAGETALHTATSVAGQPIRYHCFDALQREIRALTRGFDGRMISVDRYYDEAGRLERLSEPYFAGGQRHWNRSGYDELGRLTAVLAADGGDQVIHYDSAAGGCVAGRAGQTLTTNALGQNLIEQRNVLGETISVYDHHCGVVSYRYDAVGSMVSMLGVDGSAVNTAYDRRGRKIAVDDADKGYWQYAYNPLGELTRQLDGQGQAIDFSFDLLGRVTDRRELNGVSSLIDSTTVTVNRETTTWNNSTSSSVRGKGKVQSVVYREGSSGGVVQQIDNIYDGYGRESIRSNSIDGLVVAEETTYDQFGRVFQQFDASGDGRGIRFHYNQYGYPEKLQEAREGRAGVVYQHNRAIDARGNVTYMILGNNVEVFASFRPESGRVEVLEAYDATGSELQFVTYGFDAIGNLVERHDTSGNRSLAESFDYDGLNRLEEVMLSLSGATPQSILSLQYDSSGNITHKSDVGAYLYRQNGAGPHAVTRAGDISYTYDTNGNQITSSDGRTISYSVFDQATSIRKGTESTTFHYGIGNQRIRRDDNNAVDQTGSTWYLGSVERIQRAGGNAFFRRSLGGHATADYFPATGVQQVDYLVKDHLGSVHTRLPESGRVADAHSLGFSAFGERRLATSAAPLSMGATAVLNEQDTRGFTGHEHVDGLGVIHMNGRVYDPRLGRFLQADPVIQSPTNSQSLNRYTYVNNNPLSMTDPTGYFSLKRFVSKYWRVAVAAVASYYTFGAVSNLAWGMMPSTAAGVATTSASVASAAIGGAAAGFVGGAIIGGNLKGAVQGAFAGALMGGIAGHFGNTYSAARVAADSVAGGVSSEVYGQKFKDGMLIGALVSSATFITVRLRAYQLNQSRQFPGQVGDSPGFRGVEGKLAGERIYERIWEDSGAARLHAENASMDDIMARYATARKKFGRLSPLGCLQGGPGCISSFSYQPGSIYDYVLEGYSGVHDTLNQPFFYTSSGTNRFMTNPFQRAFGKVVNPLNVIIASPIVLPALVPDYQRQIWFSGKHRD